MELIMTKKATVTKAEVTGIKKAVGDFNHWQGCARVMFDLSTLKVWTDIFESSNSTNHYHSPSIVQIHGKDDFHGRDNKTSMIELRYLISSKSWRKHY